jgi:hypothetical protein
VRREISRSEELGKFENELLLLDQSLRKTKPGERMSPNFHNAILRAVMAKESVGRMGTRPVLALRWGVFCVLLMLAVAGWTLWLKPKDDAVADERRSLSAAAQFLEASAEMERQVPAAALAPLSGELERLNLDFDNAAQFVIASLP